MDLKTLRIRKNLTMREAGELSGISESGYSLIENGKRKPSVHTAKRIAEVLGFDWTEFFEEGDHA